VQRTEPDLDQIKQVAMLVSEAPARRFAAIQSTGIRGGGRDPRSSNLAIIWLAISLQNSEHSQEGAEDLSAKGQSGDATAPPGGSTNRATWGAEPLPAEFGETEP
jgi:hypothetical protein